VRAVWGFEQFVNRHPWLGAIPFAVIAAVVCSAIAGSVRVTLPVVAATWVLLAMTFRQASRLPPR
jgi:hypothetical protein